MWTSLDRIRRDIEELAKCNATPGNGLTRFSLTPEDQAARKYLKTEMRECGLTVYEDAAGSLFGRREGNRKNAAVVMIGSHFDSVKEGGNFDGPAGIAVALETARVLQEKGIKTQCPIEVAALIEEEGGRFPPGLFASRSMAGRVDTAQLLESKDANGISMYEALKSFGFNPDLVKNARRHPGSLKAFLELHIEQGPVLEKEGVDIGIVQHIVGIQQLRILIRGRQGHAGTTPMSMRADALVTAAKVVAAIADLAREEGDGTVATVGLLSIKPGGANIIPAEASFSVDIRAGKTEHIDSVSRRIEVLLKDFTRGTDLSYELKSLMKVDPVAMSPAIVKTERSVCDQLGLTSKLMLSGAGHDAMIMAGITDVGLLFVPSRNGRSHCPEEWTDFEQLRKGAEVYLRTVLELAEISP